MRVKMCVDITTALEDVHRRNVLHRDIKSANVLVRNMHETYLYMGGLIFYLSWKGFSESGCKISKFWTCTEN